MIAMIMTAMLLQPCPDKPNCVSTQGTGTHAIEPIRYSTTKAAAHARLLEILGSMPRAKVVADDGTTVRVEFTTLVFRFVDDAVFVFDEANRTLHFRSASRVGRSDLGVNRRRMERIRTRWSQ